jgi:hypothetical protein
MRYEKSDTELPNFQGGIYEEYKDDGGPVFFALILATQSDLYAQAQAAYVDLDAVQLDQLCSRSGLAGRSNSDGFHISGPLALAGRRLSASLRVLSKPNAHPCAAPAVQKPWRPAVAGRFSIKVRCGLVSHLAALVGGKTVRQQLSPLLPQLLQPRPSPDHLASGRCERISEAPSVVAADAKKPSV